MIKKKVFSESKKLLHCFRVLVHYDANKELIVMLLNMELELSCNTRCLMEQKPVAFASKTLNTAENKYSLSFIFGVKTFHFYFFGRTFCITNDHKSLQTLLREWKAIPIMASAHIQRWALTVCLQLLIQVYP